MYIRDYTVYTFYLTVPSASRQGTANLRSRTMRPHIRKGAHTEGEEKEWNLHRVQCGIVCIVCIECIECIV